MSQKDLNLYLTTFLTLQLTNKLYHWNTTSFARHKATDQFDDVISDFIDKYVEYYIGRFNIKPQIQDIKINQDYLSDNGFVKLFQSIKKILDDFDIKANDILAIKDELLGEVNKMLYLLKLN
jgi:DNA-binding ferritin-like protein